MIALPVTWRIMALGMDLEDTMTGCGERSLDLLLATVEHRLEQLSKPLFERGVVEQLVKEIWRLRHHGADQGMAVQLAAAHNEIDELNEQNTAALNMARAFQVQAIEAQTELRLLREMFKVPKMLAPVMPDAPSTMQSTAEALKQVAYENRSPALNGTTADLVAQRSARLFSNGPFVDHPDAVD